jgi:hypothetical protein
VELNQYLHKVSLRRQNHRPRHPQRALNKGERRMLCSASPSTLPNQHQRETTDHAAIAPVGGSKARRARAVGP